MFICVSRYSSRETDSIEAGLKYFYFRIIFVIFFIWVILLYGFTGLTFLKIYIFLTFIPSDYVLICIETAIMLLTLGLLLNYYVPFPFLGS